MVRCQGLTKTFGGKTVLDAVALDLPPGSVTVLAGPNGAGKTTLLKVLATLVTPTAGRVTVAGWDVQRRPGEVRRSIGFASSEERSFYWRLTGLQNLMFFAALHGLTGKAAELRIRSLLEAVGMEHRCHGRFSDYSTGVRQAFAIVRALLHDPPVLLLDEPTRSLSHDGAARVRRILVRLSKTQGKTILISSHNLAEVTALGDRLAVMERGRILAAGPVCELAPKGAPSWEEDVAALFERMGAGGPLS